MLSSRVRISTLAAAMLGSRRSPENHSWDIRAERMMSGEAGPKVATGLGGALWRARRIVAGIAVTGHPFLCARGTKGGEPQLRCEVRRCHGVPILPGG
jgi:hypothetical protein